MHLHRSKSMSSEVPKRLLPLPGNGGLRLKRFGGDSDAEWPLSARILRFFSRDPQAPDFAGGTATHVGDHALDFIEETVPHFREMIAGKSVLDYGCGTGEQSVALKLSGARNVLGYDPYPKFPAHEAPGVTFTSKLPTEKFDIVLSSSSFEHLPIQKKRWAKWPFLPARD